jgi:hypothetical protein
MYHSKGTAKVPGAALITEMLTKKSPYFNQALEVNAQTIIITTYYVLALRHGPASAEKWLIKQHLKVPEKWHHMVPHQDWLGWLSNVFGTVFADECQALKSMGSSMHLSIKWLFPDFIALISGTPLYAGIRDMVGYMDYIQPSTSKVQDYKPNEGEKPFKPW